MTARKAPNAHSAGVAAPRPMLQAMLEDDFLAPLSIASDTLDQLEALFNLFTATLSKDDFDTGDRLRLRRLADMGAYVAGDAANLSDAAHEIARDRRVPAILALNQGASHG